MGKTICFTGHRPNKLYGYDLEHPNYNNLKENIYFETLKLIQEKDVDKVITGGALGLDTLAFYTVENINSTFKEKYEIKNKLAVPFKNQPNAWFRQKDKDRYNEMKEIADEVVYVDTLEKYKISNIREEEYHPAKMQKRNEYMVDNSDIVIAVWNGDKKGGTWNCIKYAQKLGKEIIYINPNEI